MTAQQQAKTPFTQNPTLCSNIIHDLTNSHILTIYSFYISHLNKGCKVKRDYNISYCMPLILISSNWIIKYWNVFITEVYRFQLLCLSNEWNNLRRVKKRKTQFQFPKNQLLYVYWRTLVGGWETDWTRNPHKGASILWPLKRK